MRIPTVRGHAARAAADQGGTMSKHSWAALAGALAFTSLTAWSAPAGAAAGEWTRVPAPSPGATSSLHAVGASSSSVAWAVGETRDALGGLPQPLILRLRDGAWV